MKLFIYSLQIFLITNLFNIAQSWGDDDDIKSPYELDQHMNETREHFKNGFKEHTAKIQFRLKETLPRREVTIMLLTTNSSYFQIVYHRHVRSILFDINFKIENHTLYLKYQFPNILLEYDQTYYLVYHIGQKFFKLWINCKLQMNDRGNLKTQMDNNDLLYKYFGKDISLSFGDNYYIDYMNTIPKRSIFVSYPNYGYSFDDRLDCRKKFNLENFQVRVNNDQTEGIFHALEVFEDVLTTLDSPGIHFGLTESVERDVSEYFEDGIDKDHTFEMTYRILEFPKSKNYEFFVLKSSAETEIIFSISGKRNILKLKFNTNSNEGLTHFATDFWADKIYNTDWHTFKYTFKNGTLNLWIDGELMEDFLGFKNIDVKFKGYDTEYTWFDTTLRLLQPPETDIENLPLLQIASMTFYGNAVTTNNTALERDPNQGNNDDSKLNAFLRVVGRMLI